MTNRIQAKVGRIKNWYCGKKGYGFIHPEDGGKAVFVHFTCMAPYQRTTFLREGARVSYDVAWKKKCGLWARNVRVID